MLHHLINQDNLLESKDSATDVGVAGPAPANSSSDHHPAVPSDEPCLHSEIAEYNAFLAGSAPFPSVPGPYRVGDPSEIRDTLVAVAKKRIAELKKKIARASTDAVSGTLVKLPPGEEERQLLAFRPEPVPARRATELESLAAEWFRSDIRDGWISRDTAMNLVRVAQRSQREFPQQAVVYQAWNELRTWLGQHEHRLTDHESWVNAHTLLAQLTWGARRVGNLRQYWKFTALDRSFGQRVFRAPIEKAFFGDRRFDVRGVPLLLARRGRFYGSGYRQPSSWDDYLLDRLQQLTAIDDLDFRPRQVALIRSWKDEHADIRPQKCPIALTPEQLSNKCRFVGGAVSTKTTPAVRLGKCVELLGLAGGVRAITGEAAVPFLPALAVGPLLNEDGKPPESGQGLWVVVIDLDEPRADRDRPLTHQNLHPVARQVVEATLASGGYVEVSQSGKGIHAVRVFEGRDADRLTRLAQETHIDGVKIEFFASRPRVVAMTGRPIPGLDRTHDPATAFRSFEFDCPLGPWLTSNLPVGPAAGRRMRDDLTGIVVVPLEQLSDEHSAGPWDDMTDAAVYGSVLQSTPSYREKVEAYQAEPGSVDAHRAEWQLVHRLLQLTGENLRRAARMLRDFSPFLIGMSGKGRKSKLAGEYVVRTVLNAAAERQAVAAESEAAVGPAGAGTLGGTAGSGIPAAGPPADPPEGGDGGRKSGTGPDGKVPGAGQGRRKPTPFVQNQRAREGFQQLSTARRQYCNFVNENELADRLAEQPERRGPNGQASLLTDLIQSRTPVMPMFLESLPGLRVGSSAKDCQEGVRRCVRARGKAFNFADQPTARHSRVPVLVSLNRSGGATAEVQYYFCQSARCKRCGGPYRARAANHAALAFDQWEQQIGALYVCELQPGVAKLPDAARRAAKGYFVYTCDGLVISAYDLAGFKGVKSSERVSHETALRRFVFAINSVPITTAGPTRGKLFSGGEHWAQEPVSEVERQASGAIRLTLSGGSLPLCIEAVRTSEGGTPLDVELCEGIQESATQNPHRRFRATNPLVRTPDELAGWADRIRTRFGELLKAVQEEERRQVEELRRALREKTATRGGVRLPTDHRQHMPIVRTAC